MDVTVPTVKGVTDALKSYGAGVAGGLVYQLALAMMGRIVPGANALVGGLVAAALSGSVVKGQRGDTIATMAGFQTGLMGLSSFAGGGDDGGGASFNEI
jgi:hypothetical protein